MNDPFNKRNSVIVNNEDDALDRYLEERDNYEHEDDY